MLLQIIALAPGVSMAANATIHDLQRLSAGVGLLGTVWPNVVSFLSLKEVRRGTESALLTRTWKKVAERIRRLR